MASMFDLYQKTVFATAEAVFGTLAVWTSSLGGPAVEGKVLLNNPTEKMSVAGVDYDPTIWRIEFYPDQFPGLKDLVDTRATTEQMSIDGQDFYIAQIDTKFDGNTFIAILNPIP